MTTIEYLQTVLDDFKAGQWTRDQAAQVIKEGITDEGYWRGHVDAIATDNLKLRDALAKARHEVVGLANAGLGYSELLAVIDGALGKERHEPA